MAFSGRNITDIITTWYLMSSHLLLSPYHGIPSSYVPYPERKTSQPTCATPDPSLMQSGRIYVRKKPHKCMKDEPLICFVSHRHRRHRTAALAAAQYPSRPELPLLDISGVDWSDPLVSLGVAGSTTWLLMAMIHSCCRSSTAEDRFLGSRAKHLFKKSMPDALSWSCEGRAGGLPCAMLYMIAHSLSRLAQGRLPVAISRMTQPRDHISTAPALPGFSPLITSGDMYMGVPVMDLFGFVTAASPARVRPWRAMTLAAPKSTYLMMPLWSSRISNNRLVSKAANSRNAGLTLWLDVPMSDAALV